MFFVDKLSSAFSCRRKLIKPKFSGKGGKGLNIVNFCTRSSDMIYRLRCLKDTQ